MLISAKYSKASYNMDITRWRGGR